VTCGDAPSEPITRAAPTGDAHFHRRGPRCLTRRHRDHTFPQPRTKPVVTGREQVQAARDALARAREADEHLRAALAEATVWLTLAVTTDDNDEKGGAK
jgi:hypothetical protein